MHQIRTYFEKIVHQSEADWKVFSSRLVRQEFPKKTILLRTGETENYLSFIEKGIIRFYVPREENDVTFSFSFANEFVSAYDSFLRQEPCDYQVDTLSKTVLWRISFSDLQKVYAEASVGNYIGRHASEGLYLENITREMSLLTDTAEQRYRKLLSDKPHLIRHIPLKYIASYIGITPQALSRIRRRIS